VAEPEVTTGTGVRVAEPEATGSVTRVSRARHAAEGAPDLGGQGSRPDGSGDTSA